MIRPVLGQAGQPGGQRLSSPVAASASFRPSWHAERIDFIRDHVGSAECSAWIHAEHRARLRFVVRSMVVRAARCLAIAGSPVGCHGKHRITNTPVGYGSTLTILRGKLLQVAIDSEVPPALLCGSSSCSTVARKATKVGKPHRAARYGVALQQLIELLDVN